MLQIKSSDIYLNFDAKFSNKTFKTFAAAVLISKGRR